jgi:REP element-mobilizing transposase RayT
MRERGAFEAVRAAIEAGNERDGFRVVAFSVLSNHIHHVVEAESNEALSRGMQGLAIRIAKALNRAWGRTGRVFVERFHARCVRGVKAMRRVLCYVLQNARRHRVRLARGVVDPFSSGRWFRFWRERPGVSGERSPVVQPRDPYLRTAARAGLSLDDLPYAGLGP